MHDFMSDTIIALSTAPGVGAIGIVRLSGPEARSIAGRVFRPGRNVGEGFLESHRFHHGFVIDPDSRSTIDEVLLVAMHAPSTYTREDVVEIHCHGGPAAQRAVLQLCLRMGARPAEAGEFTKRAFLHGRIDLAQAESVAAIVQARSRTGLRAAVRQLEGGLSDTLRRLREVLLVCLAELEAGIDFADEDIDDVDRDVLRRSLGLVLDELERLLRTAFLGRMLDHGVQTAIIGAPNVGKSSLLNALVMRERAIVSEIPGTTRDTIEELIEVAGVPLRLVDTAGLRHSEDPVERLGIERSRRASASADLVLAVTDLAQTPRAASGLCGLPPDLPWERTILVGNKADKASAEDVQRFLTEAAQPAREDGPPSNCRRCVVSALTGEGLDELRHAIEVITLGGSGVELDETMLANERQRLLVERARDSVAAALAALGRGGSDELLCEDVRAGIEALGRITGQELAPDLIDEIFRRFCIGK